MQSIGTLLRALSWLKLPCTKGCYTFLRPASTILASGKLCLPNVSAPTPFVYFRKPSTTQSAPGVSLQFVPTYIVIPPSLLPASNKAHNAPQQRVFTVMAATTTARRTSNQSAKGSTKSKNTMANQRVVVRSESPATPQRSPIRKRKGVTLQQKQALIDNLQLESRASSDFSKNYSNRENSH